MARHQPNPAEAQDRRRRGAGRVRADRRAVVLGHHVRAVDASERARDRARGARAVRAGVRGREARACPERGPDSAGHREPARLDCRWVPSAQRRRPGCGGGECSDLPVE